MLLINNPIFAYLYFWGWRDCIELIFFVTLFYIATSWLNKDKTRHLVSYVYCYSILIIGSYFLQLSLLWSFLITWGPVAAIVCILMHQEILQKHLIAPVKIIPAQQTTQWLDDLLQACLISMNAQKPIICIISHKNDLSSLLETSYTLQTRVQKNILLTLFESKLFDPNTMIHITSDGTLTGINYRWVNTFKATSDKPTRTSWEIATAVITTNDNLVFRGNPESNTFDIALRGSIIENVTSANCRKILQQFVLTTQSEKQSGQNRQSKGNTHEANRP